MKDRTGVLFVCLGNICRSPLAEAIFAHMAEERGVRDRFDIDSCGTGAWHIGEPADPRSIEVARRRGVKVPCIGRQLDPARDFARFDWLIAMDRANLRSLLAAGAPEGRARLMRSFDIASAAAGELEVPDPYHWPGDGFERVYAMLENACAGLMDELLARSEAEQ